VVTVLIKYLVIVLVLVLVKCTGGDCDWCTTS
jgi:hypothetical protein